MKKQSLAKKLEGLSGNIDNVEDGPTKTILHTLLNLVESLAEENALLKGDNQKLRDEINRLKGEQGTPSIRKQSKDEPLANNDHSSEKEHKKKKPKKKKSKKKSKLKIDKTIKCEIDKSSLPDDAIFKGYESAVYQDIEIKVENIKFLKPVYYSPSLKKTFYGEPPAGYKGDYGPGVRSLVLCLHRASNMTESAIHLFLRSQGIDISLATISRILTKNLDVFHNEKLAIVAAGLKATDYQHIDDTGGRVKGKNNYVHVLCSPYYTAYFTLPKKSRLSVLGMLSQGPLSFDFDEESLVLMAELGLPKKQLVYFKSLQFSKGLSREDMDKILKERFPNNKKQQSNKRIILEACAIIGYKRRDDAIRFFIADDAPQFKKIAEALGLCWVHEGRHYKKLNPLTSFYQNVLEKFRDKLWGYYDELLDYKLAPTDKWAKKLACDFDELFSPNTPYDMLNEQIKKTAVKKKSLLLVLDYPHLPIENNSAELGARTQARIRDIHLHTMSEEGTKAKDTFSTIVETAKKLGVNVFHYIYARLTGAAKVPSLSELILEKALGPPLPG